LTPGLAGGHLAVEAPTEVRSEKSGTGDGAVSVDDRVEGARKVIGKCSGEELGEAKGSATATVKPVWVKVAGEAKRPNESASQKKPTCASFG
jgi:hypothetical protein